MRTQWVGVRFKIVTEVLLQIHVMFDVMCAVGQVVSGISKDRGAFIWRVMQFRNDCRTDCLTL